MTWPLANRRTFLSGAAAVLATPLVARCDELRPASKDVAWLADVQRPPAVTLPAESLPALAPLLVDDQGRAIANRGGNRVEQHLRDGGMAFCDRLPNERRRPCRR